MPGRRRRRARDGAPGAAGLVEPIRAWIAAGRPYLGICLGLQLLFEGSDEDGAVTLGRSPAGRSASTTRRPCPTSAGTRSSGPGSTRLFAGIAPDADFYFVHSYAGVPTGRTPSDAILARTDHGAPFVSAIARGNLLGVQFHPERSGDDGLRLLANVVALVQASVDARPGAGLMLRRRVIPCLDVKDGRVVKGTRFVDLVDEGDPPELAERYAAEGADELVFLDISAAPEGRGHPPRHRRTDRAPGVHPAHGRWRRPERRRHARRAPGRAPTRSALNTAAVADPALISACAARFGRQAVVVAIDARGVRADDAGWEVVVNGGRKATGLDAVAWAERAAELGAGELLVTSIDRDGTRLRLRHCAAAGDHRPRPGARSSRPAAPPGPADFVAAVRDGGADAVLAASIFHRRIHSIGAVKQAMADAGLPVRLVPSAAA